MNRLYLIKNPDLFQGEKISTKKIIILIERASLKEALLSL
jgi:hypothetical protein